MKMISRFFILISAIVSGLIALTPSVFCQTKLAEHDTPPIIIRQIYTESNTAKVIFAAEDNSTSCFNTKHRSLKSMVSFGIINSKAIEIPKPDYPKAAKAAHISGEVKVIVIIDRKGSVAWAQIENGNPML